MQQTSEHNKKSRLIDIENTLVVTHGERECGGGNIRDTRY